LQSLAEPGGICVSAAVKDQIGNKLAVDFEDLGEQTVKNISKPVRVFRISTEPAANATARPTTVVPRRAPTVVRRGALSLAAIAIIAGAVVLVQHLSLRLRSTSASIKPSVTNTIPNAPDNRSIAVLPFANLSGDREQEYLSDGITIDLITDLAKQADLFVIDRNSAFTYKDKAVKAVDVGKELGVKYVLEGGLEKVGDKIRITAELVDSTTGDQLWAEKYARTQSDLFALQDEIVKRIITTLSLELDVSQRPIWTGVGGGRTNNAEAYDYYLRGEKYASSLSKESFSKAREMFEKAIALDPKFPAAFVSLGYIVRYQWVWLWTQESDPLGHAYQLAQQAIALDDSPSAHGLLSSIYLSESDWEKALSEAAERAVSLDPNSADSYNVLAYVLNHVGKPNEAVAAAQKAMRLDPRHRDQYLIWIGLADTQLKRYKEAIPVVKQFQASYPNLLGSGFCFIYLIVDYVELGRDQDARASAADLLQLSPNMSADALRIREPLKDPALSELFLSDFQKAGLK